MKNTVQSDISLFSEHDIYLFKEGNHFRLYDKLGSHPAVVNGKKGYYFSVWAPNAKNVAVQGDFNGWSRDTHRLSLREDDSGIWECFIPGIQKGDIYKYHIVSKFNKYSVEKGDPFAYYWERAPKTASVVWELDYTWKDSNWMAKRRKINALDSPISIYEVHVGSWRRHHDNTKSRLTYREIAHKLVDYAKKMGFTHLELMPIMEHPFYGSWGYQCTGFFAPTSRYGTPQDLMYLIDCLHQKNIGVILDWVPSHFPSDQHGLSYFDGTYLYEHQDPKKGYHPEWKSYIFNYGRNEVKSFLISSALYWLDKYHIDGLRVDAVASMLYLDYARKQGEWIPNEYGGNENLEAISFLKRLNEAVYSGYPDVQTIAEESTAWPMVSRPTHLGGLGFGMKWNMGWMHDTLKYASMKPVHKKYHHDQLTFSLWYAFSENFVLPLSHDEVVHRKKSLIGKMPGDEWQKFANLRILFAYMYGHPGKKLIFMGGEIGQWKEWNHDEALEWDLLAYPAHTGIQNWLRDLNHLYKSEPALYENDFSDSGFEWINFSDYENSIISFIRKSRDSFNCIIFIINFTPVPRHDYRVAVPGGGFYEEILNSDSDRYWGGNIGNYGKVLAEPVAWDGKEFSLNLSIPPLGAVILKPVRKKPRKKKPVKKTVSKRASETDKTVLAWDQIGKT
ncbi:MAG: 1,4-alpha-glucan branching protein GlgB [Nitrospiraceae bacterium]|nr:MAG: 1,4-alpha-glucan branching protein GlgB [Nitrospiraceae bacterium]